MKKGKSRNKRKKTSERKRKHIFFCFERIGKLEMQVAAVEEKMATPEGASDMKLYEQHQQLKQQIATIEEEWETVSLELEELQNA